MPPNIIVIVTDDQRWDAIGVVQHEQGTRGRYPWITTPHMDRLANEGARFRNAFVSFSLCSPSRAAFLTGQFNHRNAIINNSTEFPGDAETYVTHLKAAGYRTAHVGKWHMGSQRGPRPACDYSASFIGQGEYIDCSFEIDGVETPTKGWVDDVSTDLAIDFIRSTPKSQPFLLTLGFKAAHEPFIPPDRASARFEGVQMGTVPNLEGLAPFIRKPDKPKDFLAYFRCISAADDNLGRILASIEDLGIVENTVVVFTSDNGVYHGEHGLTDKRSLYEESVRIPLIVRYPKLITPGLIIDQMVLNIDLAPTLLDVAGQQPSGGMQGDSWKSLFSMEPVPSWRNSILLEYFPEQKFPRTPHCLAVRTESAKLIVYPEHDEWTEMYDLTSDPYEMDNLFPRPDRKPLREALLIELEKQKRATGFTPTLPGQPDVQP